MAEDNETPGRDFIRDIVQADVDAGRTRPASDFFSEFDKRHGITD